MTPTSFLWSRRMTAANVSLSPPKLTPLSVSSSFSSRKSSFDEVRSEYSNATTAPSSPFLFTPTEMAGILLGDSPTSAIKRCQNSKEEYMRIQNQFDPFLKSPSSDSFNVLQCGNTISHHPEKLSDLDVELDMASLATEVALRTLDSEDEEDYLGGSTTCKGEKDDPQAWPQGVGQPKMRLLPFLPFPPQEQSSTDQEAAQPTAMSNSDGHECLPSETVDEEEAPKRKGRARMSQEKRRRLARRREREALLLGLPSSRPSSAPAQQTKFLLEELNGTVPKGNQTAWRKNPSFLTSSSQAFPLPSHPYRNELQQRRDSLMKPYSVKSYSQCLTIPSA
ncbi:uncharacterized protein FA14DRAFT_173381 [Meira miltonrushii]|uniref:Uncharacterized protein n=1 Tax=Meira miltonrushii TaxID=1280837 RepID=A0A316V8Q8_9BASI|nr:uncharacterized protein FA14DRAFT_173381 [Meira miltonrushii]PWN33604.1 hypothetical protein FA14DRAFT_173381 [Meira miltonrushii]